MKYIVYLTTNLKSKINGISRIYIGVHGTENPEIFDGYIGCGVYTNQPSTYKYPKTPFQYAVKKYGTNAFRRDTLFVYDTLKEAFDKEEELVTLDFIKQDHVYNACLGGRTNWYIGKPIYQFDLSGKLLKKWDYSIEVYEFYGISREKFNYAIYDKHPFLGYLWSNTDNLDITEYQTQTWGEPKLTHLYSKNGKWIRDFVSRKECAEYLSLSETTIVNAIKRSSLLKDSYFVSGKLVDIFIPKARKQYSKTTFYVYENYKYIGSFVGKEVMNVVNEHSWSKLREYLRNQKGWFKNFYISEEMIEEKNIPTKQFGNGIQVDVFTKYGEYLETLHTIKEVKEKYKVPASKIKNIQLGDRYYGDYIFKYHSNRLANDIV